MACLALLSTVLPLHGDVMEEISNQNGYSWDLSDETQVGQMKGMLIWGFFLAISAALLSGFIPTSGEPST